MMQVLNICLIFAALADGVVAKKNDNNNKVRPWPPEALSGGEPTGSKVRSEIRGVARHLHGRVAGEDDEESPDGEESPWYPAESLDYFRNLDIPEYFEWVNPEEIVAGGTTCGFLYPDLGTAPNTLYPTIEVYFCMRFANNQPAKKGNLMVHCGGPGTLSDCMDTFIYIGAITKEIIDDYNIVSVDQRGMGRSYPNFSHEECSVNSYVRDADGVIVEVMPPEEYLAGIDFSSTSFIVSFLQPSKRRVLRCWSCEECGFQMNATQPDGTDRTFHFLEYSGTRELSEDIERFRLWVLNAPVLNVYGISYGTSVFGAYATMFPSSVGLFVLDSCVSPDPNIREQAMGLGIGFADRIDYLIYSCSARNVQQPGSCPVADMRQCIGDVSALLDATGLGALGLVGVVVRVMYLAPARAQEICDVAASGDFDALNALIDEIEGESSSSSSTRQLGLSPSQPTSEYAVYGNPDYQIIAPSTEIALSFVRAQDNAGASYDEDFYAEELVAFNAKYRGAGTNQPALAFNSFWSHSFYWPKSVPLPPMGGPYTTGIISGSLYDPNTPYRWTQLMRAAFPSTSLLTSQSTKHGLATISTEEQPYSCSQLIVDYLNTGYVGIVDGTICGADFASEESFLGQFGIA